MDACTALVRRTVRIISVYPDPGVPIRSDDSDVDEVIGDFLAEQKAASDD